MAVGGPERRNETSTKIKEKFMNFCEGMNAIFAVTSYFSDPSVMWDNLRESIPKTILNWRFKLFSLKRTVKENCEMLLADQSWEKG